MRLTVTSPGRLEGGPGPESQIGGEIGAVSTPGRMAKGSWQELEALGRALPGDGQAPQASR